MSAQVAAAALLAAAKGRRGELDALLETMDERELAVALLALACAESPRERIAAQALQGLLARPYVAGGSLANTLTKAERAVLYADELLAELAKATQP